MTNVMKQQNQPQSVIRTSYNESGHHILIHTVSSVTFNVARMTAIIACCFSFLQHATLMHAVRM